MGINRRLSWDMKCDTCGRYFYFSRNCLLGESIRHMKTQGVKEFNDESLLVRLAKQNGWEVEDKVKCPECKEQKKPKQETPEDVGLTGADLAGCGPDDN